MRQLPRAIEGCIYLAGPLGASGAGNFLRRDVPRSDMAQGARLFGLGSPFRFYRGDGRAQLWGIDESCFARADLQD